MNYDKLSRSVRQYYKKGIIKKTANSKRLVYQFCPAYLWALRQTPWVQYLYTRIPKRVYFWNGPAPAFIEVGKELEL